MLLTIIVTELRTNLASVPLSDNFLNTVSKKCLSQFIFDITHQPGEFCVLLELDQFIHSKIYLINQLKYFIRWKSKRNAIEILEQIRSYFSSVSNTNKSRVTTSKTQIFNIKLSIEKQYATT